MSVHNRSILKGEGGDLKRYSSETHTLTKNTSTAYYTKKPQNLEIDRLVVFKKGKLINSEYYVVEISYN